MSGVGSVYRRGPYWWLQWFVRGKRYRESSGETSKHAALAKLREKLAQAEPPARGKLTLQDLIDGITREYHLNKRRSLRRLNISLDHLRKYFGGTSMGAAITAARVRDYAFHRRESGAANGTINRELSALKRALALAIEDGRLAKVPHIKLLEEAPARQGFFEHEQFTSVKRHLPEHLKDPVTFLYLTGWRLEEMQSLEWRDVDVAHGVIRLRAEKSKNKEPRILRLAGELAEVIQRAWENRIQKQRPTISDEPKPRQGSPHGRHQDNAPVAQRKEQPVSTGTVAGSSPAGGASFICPYVFHRNGHRLKDFRASWKTACRAAGVPGRLRHDFRRSTVRNLIRAGVPEKIVMATTGHRTRSIFDRYHIVTEKDLGEAQEKLTEYLSGQQSQPKNLKGPPQ